MSVTCKRRFFICLVALAALLPQPSAAADPWQPERFAQTSASVAAILARLRDGFGVSPPAYEQRVEHYSVVQAGRTFTADAFIRDGDYVVRSVIGGEIYESGTAGPMHWRRSPRGLVRLVESDVQGDDLDRWPAVLFDISPADCTLLGETATSAPAWVLRVQRAQDIPHFIYVDESSGLPLRELTREGVRTETTTFDDVQTVAGVRRPMHWSVTGPGGTLDVTVTGIDVRGVDAATVAVPGSTSDTFPLPAPDTHASLGARFTNTGWIDVPVTVAGRPATFVLDTGTPQTDIALAFARRSHMESTLGHTVAKQFSVAGSTATRVPLYAIDWDWSDGILGYDFFCGRIVHIDYAKGIAEALPRDGFVAPSDADRLPTNYDEGMPIVSARVGDADGERFVLDTGSYDLVLLRHFRQDDPQRRRAFGTRDSGREQRFQYLEGAIMTTSATVPSFLIGRARFVDVNAYVENDSKSDTFFPIDGIVGNKILRHFEWWFDADGGTTWYRLQH